MTDTLYIIPDTNLFIQCRDLAELPWSDLLAEGEIILVVTRPVQSEIDKHKNGHGRVQRRARKVATLFRDLLLKPPNSVEIKPNDPNVRVVQALSLKPSPALASELNFEKPDDALVATAVAFADANVGKTVRVLTHDTGVIATAQSLNVEFRVIPDDWLLDVEADEDGKALAALKAENAKLKKAEPVIKILCQDRDGVQVDRITASIIRYMPLTDDQVSVLIQALRDHHPIATNFEPTATDEMRASQSIWLNAMRTFAPPTTEEIEAYKSNEYPKWLDRCEKALRNLHLSRENTDPIPAYSFIIDNSGTRPAKDVLVEISASGSIEIRPDDDLQNPRAKLSDISLPSPPSPPRGRWSDPIGRLAEMSRLTQPSPFIAPFPHVPKARDPNGFYWKPRKPQEPVTQYALECEQWRHGLGPDNFGFEIYGTGEEGQFSFSGMVMCRVHAENISIPITKRVPIAMTIEEASIFEFARTLIVGRFGSF